MIVDLTTLKNSETSFDFTLAPEDVGLENEPASLINEVRAQVSLKKGIVQTDVEGKIFAKAVIDCSRCLQDVESDLDISFTAVFIAPEHYTEAKEAELETDDLEVSIIDDSKIDLIELVREQILLNLPLQVFCQQDCQGLCPKCGANRNLIDCKCKENEIDPRWASLKNLK